MLSHLLSAAFLTLILSSQLALAAPASPEQQNCATSQGDQDPNRLHNTNPQTSRILDPKVIAPGFASDGNKVPEPGQAPSLTSTNNFINFCLTVPKLPITNGKQIPTGSCNPAPMGVLPSKDNMPSAKFVFPPNLATLKANTPFTIKMAVKNLETGLFVNPQANYYAGPQQLSAKGLIKGHSHVVIEQLTSLAQVAPTDPRKFAFFKGLNSPAVGGLLTAAVAKGLPAGTYRISSINSASNHQPVLAPIAQHGSLDDAAYFTVTSTGKPNTRAVDSSPSAPKGEKSYEGEHRH